METDSLFLKQPPRILGLANATKMLPMETGDSGVGNIISALQDNYNSQNALVKISEKNNEIILKEVMSINKKLENLVGYSKDEDRRAKLRENRERQENSRMLKGLQKIGNNVGKSLKRKASNIAGGLLDTLFPGLSRMLKGFGTSSGALASGLLGLLFGVPLARKFGARLLAGSGKGLGLARLGKGLFTGSTQRLFRQRIAKAGIFGALFGVGKGSFAGAKGAQEASKVIKSLEFTQLATGKTLTKSFKDVQKSIKAYGGMSKMLNWMKSSGVMMTGMNGTKLLGKANPYKVFEEVMSGGKAVKDAKGLGGFAKAAKKAFSKGGMKSMFKGAAKETGKTAGKVAGKKIPILGAVLGSVFAVQRWREGDKAGAGLELLSGLASTIPGWGTAISLGIDAGLFARDIGRQNGQKGGFWGTIKGLFKGGGAGALGVLGGGAASATLLQRLAEGGGLGNNLYQSSVFASLFQRGGNLSATYDALLGGNGVSLDKVLNNGAGGGTGGIGGGTGGGDGAIIPAGIDLNKLKKENAEIEKKLKVYSDPNSMTYKARHAELLEQYIKANKSGWFTGAQENAKLEKEAKVWADKQMNEEKYILTTQKNKNSQAISTISSGNPYKSGTNASNLYNILRSKGYSHAGTLGIMANLNAEGGLSGSNLENMANKNSGLSDAEFTRRVDSGQITRAQFLKNDAWGYQSGSNKGLYGYGHAQWTSPSRKARLYDEAKRRGVSISDTQLQMDLLAQELKEYGLEGTFKSIQNVNQATDIFMRKFEKPDMSKTSAGARIAAFAKGGANFVTDTGATLINALAPNMAGGMAEYTTRKKEFIDSAWATYRNMQSGESSFTSGSADAEATTKVGAQITSSYLTGGLNPDKYNVATQQTLPTIDTNALLWWQLLMQM